MEAKVLDRLFETVVKVLTQEYGEGNPVSSLHSRLYTFRADRDLIYQVFFEQTYFGKTYTLTVRAIQASAFHSVHTIRIKAYPRGGFLVTSNIYGEWSVMSYGILKIG